MTQVPPSPPALDVETSIEQAIPTLLAMSEGTKKPFVIGVCGGTSTGKSTIITQFLKSRLPSGCEVINQDNFQALQQNLHLLCATYGLDHPEHYGIEACIASVRNLRKGRSVGVPRYDFIQRAHHGLRKITPTRFLIIEGLYAGYGDLRYWLDWLIYIESPAWARLIRRLFRNRYERYPGLPQDGDRAIASFLTRVQRAHEDFIHTQKASATSIIRNPIDFQFLVCNYRLPVIEAAKDTSVEIVWREDFLENWTSFLLTSHDDSFEFEILHEDRCYFRCPVSQETVALIQSANWTRH
jgi:uridine kinase